MLPRKSFPLKIAANKSVSFSRNVKITFVYSPIVESVTVISIISIIPVISSISIVSIISIIFEWARALIIYKRGRY